MVHIDSAFCQVVGVRRSPPPFSFLPTMAHGEGEKEKEEEVEVEQVGMEAVAEKDGAVEEDPDGAVSRRSSQKRRGASWRSTASNSRLAAIEALQAARAGVVKRSDQFQVRRGEERGVDWLCRCGIWWCW